MNRPRVEPVFDHATGGRICAHCAADIEGRLPQARYCGYPCQNRAKARRQRKEHR